MTTATTVSTWPRISVAIIEAAQSDGHPITATLTINSVRTACAASTADALRAGVIYRCVMTAQQLNRPVALEVTEGGGTHRLAVRQTGIVQLLPANNHIPASTGLTVMTANCQHCKHTIAVTTPTCEQCGVHEPLNVEQRSRIRHPAPRPARAAAQPHPAPTGETPPEDRTVAIQRTPYLAVKHNDDTHHATRLVVGRRPESIDGRETLTLPSPEQHISRSHATIDLHPDHSIVVTDLKSANGTTTRAPDHTEAVHLTPNSPMTVPPGSTLTLGDATVTVSIDYR